MRCCIWFHYHIAVWNIGRIYLDVEFCLWHGDDLFGEPAGEQARRYTIRGHMACLKEQGRTEENGISLMPFAVDRYSMILLVFFLIQLAVICFFQRA